jgi:hypothetical protein
MGTKKPPASAIHKELLVFQNYQTPEAEVLKKFTVLS